MKVYKTQSIDTTATIVTETFQAEEKDIAKKFLQINNMSLLPVF